MSRWNDTTSPDEKRIVKSLHELDDVIKRRKEQLERLNHPTPLTPKTPDHRESAEEIAERELKKEEVLKRKRQIKDLQDELEDRDEKRRWLLARVDRLEKDREDCGMFIQMLSSEKVEMEQTLLDVAHDMDERETQIYQLSSLHDADSKRLNMAQIKEYHLKKSLYEAKQQLMQAKKELNYSGKLPELPGFDLDLSRPMPKLIAQRQQINKMQRSVMDKNGATTKSQGRTGHLDGGVESYSAASGLAKLPERMAESLEDRAEQSPWEAGMLALMHGMTIVLLFVALGMWVNSDPHRSS